MSTADASARPTIISSDTQRGDREARTPPGQTLTAKWPVLHFGEVPRIDRSTWRLRIDGCCEQPLELDWEQFMQLPQVDVHCDIHCVTRWSRLDNRFTGVSTQAIIDLVRPTPEARFVVQHADSDPDGSWTTNVPMDQFAGDDCLLARAHDDEPLSPDHGGPVRVVIPRLYFWKGAKWLSRIEFTEADRPGFWEVNGYHNDGDPWREERFGW
ncbi:MAG: sulfite oxidase-like oxidoreductase [Phycisphaerales bacterium]|nr:sulfite oxidase-like oxidoreductase [Phycisphaerales bacterium]